jgi:hypothetical protein
MQKGKRQVSKAFVMSEYKPSVGAHKLFTGYESWVSQVGALKVVVT